MRSDWIYMVVALNTPHATRGAALPSDRLSTLLVIESAFGFCLAAVWLLHVVAAYCRLPAEVDGSIVVHEVTAREGVASPCRMVRPQGRWTPVERWPVLRGRGRWTPPA